MGSPLGEGFYCQKGKDIGHVKQNSYPLKLPKTQVNNV